MHPLLKLIRFDKPIGTLLLWWPTFWALLLASNGKWSLAYLWFALGTFFMRSAGCVMNDIADRKIDKYVARTRDRPLTNGSLRLIDAYILLIFLLLAAFLVLMQLNPKCYVYAVFSVLISMFYPLCKRFFRTPQSVLALAFSMGIPMAFVALNQSIGNDVWLLLIINMMWVFAYDTLYACVDLPDDYKIGVNSSAIFLGNKLSFVIIFLWIAMQVLWLRLLWIHSWGGGFIFFWALSCVQLSFQYYCLRNKYYFRAFISNNWYGFLLALGLMLQFFFT